MGIQRKEFKSKFCRKYIIELTRWRSYVAFHAALITVVFSLYAIAGGIVNYAEDGHRVSELMHWFTIDSNFLTSFSASMLIPFAVEGIRKKHFSAPKWVGMFLYSGVVCTTLTMAFSVLIMSWVDPHGAFGGYNIFLHILCPITVLIAFFLIETGFRFSLKEAVIASVPAIVYALIYIWQVFIVGEENGGWEDMYHVMDYLPAPVSILLISLLTLGIALLIRWLYNSLNLNHHRRMIENLGSGDVDPAEINVEVFGLGRYMGKHADPRFVELPVEMIDLIADRYDLSTEELMRVYIRGFLDSLKEKRGKNDSGC